MKYVILYQVGGIGRFFFDSAHDDQIVALSHLHDEAREHPARTYEMRCVNPHVLEALHSEVTA